MELHTVLLHPIEHPKNVSLVDCLLNFCYQRYGKFHRRIAYFQQIYSCERNKLFEMKQSTKMDLSCWRSISTSLKSSNQ